MPSLFFSSQIYQLITAVLTFNFGSFTHRALFLLPTPKPKLLFANTPDPSIHSHFSLLVDPFAFTKQKLSSLSSTQTIHYHKTHSNFH